MTSIKDMIPDVGGQTLPHELFISQVHKQLPEKAGRGIYWVTLSARGPSIDVRI